MTFGSSSMGQEATSRTRRIFVGLLAALCCMCLLFIASGWASAAFGAPFAQNARLNQHAAEYNLAEYSDALKPLFVGVAMLFISNSLALVTAAFGCVLFCFYCIKRMQQMSITLLNAPSSSQSQAAGTSLRKTRRLIVGTSVVVTLSFIARAAFYVLLGASFSAKFKTGCLSQCKQVIVMMGLMVMTMLLLLLLLLLMMMMMMHSLGSNMMHRTAKATYSSCKLFSDTRPTSSPSSSASANAPPAYSPRGQCLQTKFPSFLQPTAAPTRLSCGLSAAAESFDACRPISWANPCRWRACTSASARTNCTNDRAFRRGINGFIVKCLRGRCLTQPNRSRFRARTRLFVYLIMNDNCIEINHHLNHISNCIEINHHLN